MKGTQHTKSCNKRIYKKKERLHYSLSAVEYAMENSYKTLLQLVGNFKNLDGLVAYSVFQLPYEDNLRNKVFETSN